MVLKDVVGLLCCVLVYVCVLYADFAFVVHLLIPFANGTLATLLAIVFNVAIVMILLSHAKATLSDPGYVPLPEARIDFSDRDALQGRVDDWTICQRCEMWRPPRAHHCRVCKRCVRKMDHHCPWVNNCVGEWNQKFFILFLFYTFFCSILASVVVACYWKTVWTVDNIDHTPHVVTLLIEASLFGLFTAMVLYDQVYAIIDDETAVEARKRETGKLKGPVRKRQVTNLTKMREVFGPGSYWSWLLPRANRKGTNHSPMLTPLLSYSV